MTAVIVRTQEELCRLKSYCTFNEFSSRFGKIDRWSVWKSLDCPDEFFLKLWFVGKYYKGYNTCWLPSTPDVTDITVDEFINNFNINLGEIK